MGKTRKEKVGEMSPEEIELYENVKKAKLALKELEKSLGAPVKKSKKKTMKREGTAKNKPKKSSKDKLTPRLSLNLKAKSRPTVMASLKTKMQPWAKFPPKSEGNKQLKGWATAVEGGDGIGESSSKKGSDPVDDMMLGDMRHMVRMSWSPTEEPLCIIGTCLHQSTVLYLVRIKTSKDKDVEAVKKDPSEGFNANNSRITVASELEKLFPQLLIEYYEQNTIFATSSKDPETEAADAARALRHHKLLAKAEKSPHPVDATRIYRDMLPNLLQHLNCTDKEASADEDGAVAGCSSVQNTMPGLIIDEKAKEKVIKYHNELRHLMVNRKVEIPECRIKRNEERKKDPLRKDRFGLPLYYSASDYSDYVTSSSSEEDSSS